MQSQAENAGERKGRKPGKVKNMKYNYFEAVKADVMNWISENIDLTEYAGERDRLQEELNDSLWMEDSVTGNASGSYFCNTWKSEECLSHNWDEIERAASEFGIEPKISDGYEYGAEYWDVTIRCYYLNQAIYEVLDELEAQGAFEAEAEEEETAESAISAAAATMNGIMEGFEKTFQRSAESATETVTA